MILSNRHVVRNQPSPNTSNESSGGFFTDGTSAEESTKLISCIVLQFGLDWVCHDALGKQCWCGVCQESPRSISSSWSLCDMNDASASICLSGDAVAECCCWFFQVLSPVQYMTRGGNRRGMSWSGDFSISPKMTFRKNAPLPFIFIDSSCTLMA